MRRLVLTDPTVHFIRLNHTANILSSSGFVKYLDKFLNNSFSEYFNNKKKESQGQSINDSIERDLNSSG